MHKWDASLAGVVELPDGRRVRGRSLRAGSVGDARPEFGVYLTSRPHQESWDHTWVPWPDFRLPSSSAVALAALKDAYELSNVMKVEIACDGGKGRTGTAIAILARYAGVPAEDAVAWTRRNYRAGAIETPWQRSFVRRVQLPR